MSKTYHKQFNESSAILLCAPPKFRNRTIQFQVNFLWKYEARLHIYQKSLDHKFDENFLFPFQEKLDDQVLILLCSLSLTKANIRVFEPWIFSARPKYVPMPLSWQIPKVFFIAFLVWLSKSFPNITEDFDRLIYCPEASPYRQMI